MKRVADPSVYDFDTFPEFLTAYVNACKAVDKKFSVRWLARSLGIKSHSYIVKMMQGEKAPSEAAMQSLCDLIGLDAEAAVFLKTLAGYSSAKAFADKSYYAERLAALRQRDAAKLLDLEAIALLSNWYATAILEMFFLKDCQTDAAAIAARLVGGVTPENVQTALERMIGGGLVIRGPKGKLQRSDKAFTSPHNFPSTALRDLHRQFMELGISALADVPVERRCNLSHVLPISADKIPAAKELMIEFRRRFHTLVENSQGEEVYCLAMQFFPLTQ